MRVFRLDFQALKYGIQKVSYNKAREVFVSLYYLYDNEKGQIVSCPFNQPLSSGKLAAIFSSRSGFANCEVVIRKHDTKLHCCIILLPI